MWSIRKVGILSLYAHIYLSLSKTYQGTERFGDL